MQYIFEFILSGLDYPFMAHIFYNMGVLSFKFLSASFFILFILIPVIIFITSFIGRFFIFLGWKDNFFEKIKDSGYCVFNNNGSNISLIITGNIFIGMIFFILQGLLDNTIKHNLWWGWIGLIIVILFFIFKGKGSSINGATFNQNQNTVTPQDQIAFEHKKQLEAKYKLEQEEKKKQELHNRRIKLIPEGYINTFLNHAERKFHKRDKYGNLDKSALDKEIVEYLGMIAKQQGHTDQLRAIDALSRGNSYPRLNDDYAWLKSYLKQIFEKHISEKEKKSQQGGIDIKTMSGVEFERYLAKIFENAGYVINYTPESGDQGADLVASKGNNRLVVQAKRYTASVGNGAVQEVIGAIRYYNGTEGWVITNSVYTSSARELARINNIRLIDGSELMKLANLI